MSSLLQRLIDRTRAPLSAIQPILPSVYTPAARAEIESEPMMEVRESVTTSTQLPPRPAQVREPPGSVQPVSADPAASGESPAASPSPAREPRNPTPETSVSNRTPPPQPESPPRSKDGGRTPVTVGKFFPEQAETISSPPPPPPPLAGPGIRKKNREEGPVIKTFVPRDLASKTAHKIGRPGLTPASKPSSEIKPDLPSAPVVSPAAKAPSPTEEKPEEKVSRAKTTMPSFAATMKWIGGEPQVRSVEKSTPDAGRSETPESPEAAPRTKTARPHDPTAASWRDNREDGSAAPTSRDPLSMRPAETSVRRMSQSEGHVPPVEVNVSIGHIEVKSVAPSPPAPRRTPRPRVTLDEFLKSPHYGGPR
jgi:hypothetical protein